MTRDQLSEAFDASLKTIKTIVEANPGAVPEKQVDMVMAVFLLIKEYMVDHKRIADALEQRAVTEIELDKYRQAYGEF